MRKNTQSYGTLWMTNVESQYLSSNAVMCAAHLAGQSYRFLYATLPLGESLEWLDKKCPGDTGPGPMIDDLD